MSVVIISQQQLNIMKHLMNGLNIKEVQDAMGISKCTVKAHLRKIRKKLEAKTIVQCAAIIARGESKATTTVYDSDGSIIYSDINGYTAGNDLQLYADGKLIPRWIGTGTSGIDRTSNEGDEDPLDALKPIC